MNQWPSISTIKVKTYDEEKIENLHLKIPALAVVTIFIGKKKEESSQIILQKYIFKAHSNKPKVSFLQIMWIRILFQSFTLLTWKTVPTSRFPILCVRAVVLPWLFCCLKRIKVFQKSLLWKIIPLSFMTTLLWFKRGGCFCYWAYILCISEETDSLRMVPT